MKKQPRYATATLAAACVALMLASEPRVRVAGRSPGSLRDVDADLALFAQAAGVPQECAVEVLAYLRALIHNWIHGAPVQRTLFDELDDCAAPSPLLLIANWIDDIPAVFFVLDEAIVDGSNCIVEKPALPACLAERTSDTVQFAGGEVTCAAHQIDAELANRSDAVACLGPTRKARNQVPAAQAALRAKRRRGQTVACNSKHVLDRVLAPQQPAGEKLSRPRKAAAVVN